MRQSDMDMRNFFSGIVMCAVALAMAGCTPQREKDLVAAFENPPQEAKPVMIWQWMDGWVSREGITHDLEAYAEAGLGGVQNFQVGGPEQTDFAYEKYPVGSPGWKEMMRFAMEECARLGLSFGTHNCPGWSSSAYPDVTPEYSMLELVWTVTPWRAGQRSAKLPQPTERLGFYRDICVLALPAGADPVPADAVQDVSAAMSGDGTLDWDPQGRSWDIYRFGYTTLNKRDDATSPASGAGLECDKMSREAVRRFFEGYPSMILDLAGDLAGKTLVDFEIDSYEQKSQSWTPAMEAEFASHRGYALRVWLPVLAGRTVESAARSAQFRSDWKATIEDLFAENYYAYMSELVKQTPGMRLLIQPYGDPLDPEKVASQDEDFILCGQSSHLGRTEHLPGLGAGPQAGPPGSLRRRIHLLADECLGRRSLQTQGCRRQGVLCGDQPPHAACGGFQSLALGRARHDFRQVGDPVHARQHLVESRWCQGALPLFRPVPGLAAAR